jgi:hypothetical protein
LYWLAKKATAAAAAAAVAAPSAAAAGVVAPTTPSSESLMSTSFALKSAIVVDCKLVICVLQRRAA